jgi:hypothetical protein
MSFKNDKIFFINMISKMVPSISSYDGKDDCNGSLACPL